MFYKDIADEGFEQGFREGPMTTLEDTYHTDPRRGYILSLASIVCFASTALILSHINTHYGLSGWVTAAYRGIIGLIAIGILQNKTGTLRLSHIIRNRLLFMRGLVGGAAIPIFYICIMEIGAGRASILTGIYPLFAAVFAMILLKENIRWTYGIYITIAIVGLITIFADDGLGGGNPYYDALALCGAGAAGICVVMIRHLRHSENTSNIFASQCVFTLVIGLVMSGSDILITDTHALFATLIASLTVVGGQLCITESFRHITVAQGSTLQMLTPATTCALSVLLLGERFGALELMGGAAILFASYQISKLKS